MSPTFVRRIINFWPPLFFSGIRVTRIAADWSRVDVRLRLRWWNRNAVGTMFGGSLFAMTDPFYPLMLQHHLGSEYTIWVKMAEIEFIAPGHGVAVASFHLSAEQIRDIRTATDGGKSHRPTFAVDISDPSGKPIARVTHVLYIRQRRKTH